MLSGIKKERTATSEAEAVDGVKLRESLKNVELANVQRF